MTVPRRPALGRGLDALLPAAASAGREPGGLRKVGIEQLHPDPDQPRKRFDDAALSELARSLSTHGLLQPIVVTPRPQGGYTIVAGERRWRAAQRCGLLEVPIVIRDTPQQERLEVALVENLQRVDLDPIEQARAYAQLVDLRGYTQAQLAERVGKDRSTVANSLRLLALPPQVQDAVTEGRLTMGHARALLGVPDPAELNRLANACMREGWSVRVLERRIRELRRSRASVAPAPADDEQRRAEIIRADLERRLSAALGVRANLHTQGPKGPGRLVIPWRDLDDLGRIVERILGDDA